MGAIAELYATIGADTSKFQSALKGVKSALGDLGGIIGGISFAGIFTAAIGEASEAEQVMAQLDLSLQRLGSSTNITKQQLTDLASAMQATTRFSDDTVLSVENLLLRVKGLGEENMPRATQAALDMATALGTDATDAANLITKALARPAEAAGMLAKQGIILDASQQKLIKQMLALNKVGAAHEIIINAIMDKYGGAAEAAGNTFAGKLDILRNKFSDILETVGGALLPVLTDLITRIGDFLDMLGPAAPIIVSVVAALAGLPAVLGVIGALLGVILSPLGLIIGAVALVAAAFATNFGGIRTTIEGVWNTIQGPLNTIKTGIENFFKTLFSPEGTVNVSEGPTGYITATVSGPGGIGDRIAKAFSDLGPRIKTAIEDLFKNLGIDPKVIDNILSVVQGPLDKISAGIKGFIDNLSGADMSGVSMVLSALGNALAALAAVAGAAVLGTLEGLAAALPSIGAAIHDFIDAIAKLGQGDIGGALKGVGDGLAAIAQGALQIPLDIATRIGGILGIDVPGGLKAWEGVRDSIGAIWDWIVNKINEAVNTVSTAISTGFNAAKTAIDVVMQGIQDGMSAAWAAIIGTVQNAIGSVQKVFGAIGDAITSGLKAARDFLQGLVDLIRQITGFKPPSWAGGGGHGGGHAAGGPVLGYAAAGLPTTGLYRINEQNQEFFRPAGSGMVTPIGAGGGITIGVVNVYGVQDAASMYDQIRSEARRRNRVGLAGAM